MGPIKHAPRVVVKKKKSKKRGDHWGVDKQTSHPWELDVDTGDPPKVAAGIPMMKQKQGKSDASSARKMRRESQS